MGLLANKSKAAAMVPESKPASFSDLRRRVESAGILILGSLGIGTAAYYFCLGKFILVALVVAALTICSWEFATICGVSSRGLRARFRVGYFALITFTPLLTASFIVQALFRSPVCGLQLELLAAMAIALVSFVISFIGAILLIVVEGRSDLDEATQVSRELPIGIFLIGLCGALIVILCGQQSSPRLMLWLLLVVCFNDAAAYFVGSKLKGPRLAEAISPKKTFSGAIGGSAGGVLVGLISYKLIPGETSFVQAVLLSSGLVLAAQIGDLAKSYIKRLHAVKDSGNIIPGHGGVLDRVDGILAAGALLSAWMLARSYLLG